MMVRWFESLTLESMLLLGVVMVVVRDIASDTACRLA